MKAEFAGPLWIRLLGLQFWTSLSLVYFALRSYTSNCSGRLAVHLSIYSGFWVCYVFQELEYTSQYQVVIIVISTELLVSF